MIDRRPGRPQRAEPGSSRSLVARFGHAIPDPLSLAAMASAPALLIGRHDFNAFRSVGSEISSSVRTVMRSEWRNNAGLLTYEISGDGFLRHMVRAIVGTLVDVGRGWRRPEEIPTLLAGPTRAEAGPTAPALGLFLVSVDYD